ncbi:YopX family protein [Fusobacterium necrophorum]|uniref:YopX family protein n=1 Tax=Fusobacterium necrophorum TaxID=859 RepID=UPI00254E2B0B|nr:YopX family protein [Fusobacterium necrophorum]MDK4524971.1 YopX family protein [Fusobacterium necrophorum]
MREIKFRSFVKKDKCICKTLSIELNRGLDGTLQVEYPDGAKTTLSLHFVKLMQYTGLKDKNGKEIYEGDIVVWIDSGGNKRQNKVFFKQGAFRICNLCFEISEYGELEVIGNVYENPELLKEEKEDEY